MSPGVSAGTGPRHAALPLRPARHCPPPVVTGWRQNEAVVQLWGQRRGPQGEAGRQLPGERRAAARGPAGGQASAPLTENGRRVEAQSRPGTAAEEGAALWASPALRGQAEQTEW